MTPQMPLSKPLSRQPSARLAGTALAGLLWLGLASALPLAGPALADGRGLQLAVTLLTLFVAAIVASFSRRYMRADPSGMRYFAQLGLLVAAVLTAVLAGNLIALGAAWCASGWLLSSLIGHASGWSEARVAARRARLTFAIGDAALLAGLAVLGGHAGSSRIDAALAAASTLPPAAAGLAAALLVIAAAARAALPPFSGWLLGSMTAPTPVSALMHAGLVNAGGFLLIRFAPLLEHALAARALAIALGAVAALYGVGVMMVRPDVKRALAGSTVSQMGFMVLSCGLGLPAAALWHMVAHGLFKAWFFLGSGSTIGMRPAHKAPALSGRAALAIAAAALLLALALRRAGVIDPAALPLVLAGVTALATLPALLGGAVPLRVRLGLLLGVAMLIALHSIGLRLAAVAIGNGGAPPLPGWVFALLLAGFLAAWVWQQHRLVSGHGLPLALYVHFLNAGALAAPPPGDR